MRPYSVPLGRLAEYPHPAPDRTVYRQVRWDSDCYCKVWTNRAAMARMIRMQQRRESRPDDWRPIVKLSTTEGY